MKVRSGVLVNYYVPPPSAHECNYVWALDLGHLRIREGEKLDVQNAVVPDDIRTQSSEKKREKERRDKHMLFAKAFCMDTHIRWRDARCIV